MQVRAFIKPDQVALMLSAGDWLSDRPGVCLQVRGVCLHTGIFNVHFIMDIQFSHQSIRGNIYL